MNVNADPRKSLFVSSNLESANPSSVCSLPAVATELMFTQDISGRYLSFYWQKEGKDLPDEQIVGQLPNEMFGPVDLISYLARVQRILESLVPER